MAMTTDKARTSGWLAAGLALMVTAAVAAQSTTVRGTVEQVDKARVEVLVVDDHGERLMLAMNIANQSDGLAWRCHYAALRTTRGTSRRSTIS